MRIGCNHIGNMYLGGIASSFDGIFTEEEVLVETGLSAIIPCVIGDVTDAYKMLKEEVTKLDSSDFEILAQAVLNTVCDYFGDYSNISTRLDNYPDEDDIDDETEIGKVSNLKGKNSAMCVERAMLSQNLLKSLGLKSYYKVSEINKNGKSEVHAYNLVKNNDKHYLFDSTIPTEKDGIMTPIITEIPKEVFDKMKSPLQKEGYSVRVEHYNPLRDEEVTITYDANREDIYDTVSRKIL